ncbi:pyridoxal phosphate-dependent aminotransferase [Aureivirga sp. CE67]|uniref:pyridoxal phosphate-dependent aminotransferase n=1 Tax=Aureivirga sp. CE67 TaxID=1788983 RepID=UPI0018CA1FC5|nr:histidinol-phosphate transaminase [Aureivirga sp. CE67]
MKNNRRDWLKTVGLGIAGLSLSSFDFLEKTNLDVKISSSLKFPISLESNENPYRPSPLAKKAMMKNIDFSNRYGWIQIPKLKKEIVIQNNVNENNILLDAGSTKLLELVLQFAGLHKGNFITPELTYSYWMSPYNIYGLEKITIPLKENKHQDLEKTLDTINNNTKMVFICNPNNPTGILCKREEIIDFIDQVPKNVIILIDEAYIEFTDEKSLCNLIFKYPNLIITRTFSKIRGLAGARVGYAMADKNMIKTLCELQSWPNGSLSNISIAAAISATKDVEFLQKTKQLNNTVKEYTIDALEKLNIKCIPSKTNFLYLSLEEYPKDYFKQLEKNRILGTKIYEEKGKWTRITIGTIEEMQYFIQALS